MKYIILFSIAFLYGCSTVVPVVAKFPDAPVMLLQKCPPQLQTLDGEKITIIDLTKTVTLNYTTYYECAVKTDAWIEWYVIQKNIFETLK